MLTALLSLPLLSFPAVAETPEEIFARGNAAYEAGRYDEARDAYRTLLKYRIRDARVHYNLGNTEFRLGRLGSAILHFERARRLDPVDEDIRQNLEYARTFCFDRVEPAPVPAAVTWLRGVQDRIGPDRQLWVALAIVWAIGGVLAFALSRPGRWRPGHGWAVAGLALCLLATVFSWRSTWARLDGTPQAVVLRPSVEVLAGPGTSNPTLFTVHEGLTIAVRDVRDDWVQVGLPNGLNGWVPRDALGIV